MKWQVTAADAQTGEDRLFVIDAATAADAEASARAAGYLVSHVVAAPPATTPRPAAEGADPLAALAAAAAAAPAPLAYLPPVKARPSNQEVVAAPEYWGLRFGSTAFLVFTGLFYLAGLLSFLAGLVNLLASLGDTPGSGVVGALSAFLMSVSPLVLGAVFHALSSACLALRDIARNSFAHQ